MARETILVNLQRCTGCWSCSLGCKMVNELNDDEFRIMVKTLGNGHGTDRPAGTWPKLHMTWQPTWSKQCTGCAEGKTDHGMFCVYTCPSNALMHGEAADAEADRLAAEGFEVFELSGEEAQGSRGGVKYARPAAAGAPADWEHFEIEEAEFVADDGTFAPTLDGTLIGELFENPATAAVLERLIPWLDISTPEGASAKGMTLAAMAPFSQGLLDDDTLAAIAGEFAKVAASAFKVDEITIGEMAENPYAAKLLEELLPWLDLSTEEGAMSKGMTLAALAPFSQGLLDVDTLATFAERLANPASEDAGEAADSDGPSDASALRPAGGYTLDTKIRDLEKDPEAWAILAKVMPGFEIGSKEARQAGGMSIKSMARFAKDILTPEALAEIEAGFAALGGGTGETAPSKKKGLFARLFGR